MKKIAVIGLGYVGLPLAIEFAKAGFSVIGVDTDRRKIRNIRGIRATTDYSVLGRADAIIICVPTPLSKTKEPDVSYVVNAVKKIARYINSSRLIVLESTTYPGMTEELVLPILSRSGRQVGKDFFLAYSPQRIDPGNKRHTITKISKIVSGVTPECLRAVVALYRRVFPRLVPVSSTKVAETIKLLENTFRTVNIALVDEIAMMCHRMGIDVWEVIRGAATKPFGFMPFYPGPGLGGACLPKDPLYLAWRAKQHDYQSRFIALASDITSSMPGYVIDRLVECLKRPIKGAKILIIGVTYKEDIADTRDSPGLEIIRLLRKKGASVVYNDPYVPQAGRCRSVNISDRLIKTQDAVLIAAAHSSYDYDRIVKNARLVFDTRGVTRGSANVVRL